MCEQFHSSFSSHGGKARSVSLHVDDSSCSAHLRVACSLSLLMPVKPSGQVARVARVVAAVVAQQQIDTVPSQFARSAAGLRSPEVLG